MVITFRENGDIVIINVTGRLGLNDSQDFRTSFDQKITLGKRKYAIDLSLVEYIDSSGFGALIGCVRDLTPVNGLLVLFGMKENVEKVFKMTRLDKVMSLCTTEQEAVTFLKSVELPGVSPKA